MKKIKTGKCHCAQSSYSVEGAKKLEFLCHCTDCRVLGGGNLSAMAFSKAGLKLEGEKNLKTYSYSGGSGKKINYYFCSDCGTGLFAFPEAHPDIVVIRSNTLDDSTDFSPEMSLFPESAFSWDRSVIAKK